MLLRLLCCDDEGWREWGPGGRRSLVSWHRGAIERIRGRARCGNVARLSTIVRRNRSPPPIDGDAAVHRNPAFDRCVCLTPPRTHAHQSSTTDAVAAAALYSVSSTAMVFSAPC